MRRFLTLIPVLAFAVACDERIENSFGLTGPATKLTITGQPSSVAAGAAITPAMQVVVQNALGQTVENANLAVAISITPGTGTAGAVLNGSTTVTTTSGVANFNNLRINLAGTGYTLTASAQGLTASTSNPFDVTP